MRNIKVGRNNFMEIYPDNGDMNIVEVIRVLRDVGYDGIVMLDHTPPHGDPASHLQGHALSFGYNIALIQAMANEV